MARNGGRGQFAQAGNVRYGQSFCEQVVGDFSRWHLLLLGFLCVEFFSLAFSAPLRLALFRVCLIQHTEEGHLLGVEVVAYGEPMLGNVGQQTPFGLHRLRQFGQRGVKASQSHLAARLDEFRLGYQFVEDC